MNIESSKGNTPIADPGEIERVFILRPDNLGDVLLFSGSLKHIRARFPSAEITICVKREVRTLLELCPYVDRVAALEEVLFPLIRRLAPKTGTGVSEAFQQLESQKVELSSDLLILPVRSPTPLMHKIVEFVQAKWKYGISGDLCNQSQWWDTVSEEYYSDRLRVSDERQWCPELEVTRDFMRFLGMEVEKQDVWPDIWTDKADRRIADSLQPMEDDETLLGVCMGVSRLQGKIYPADKLEAALGMHDRRTFHCVLLGTPAEARTNALVEEHLKRLANVRAVINLTGCTTVRELVHVLDRCDTIIASDSAPLHLAVALGKPTVGIIGGGHCARFYPWGKPKINRVVQRIMDCYGCNWHCKYPTMQCVHDIPPRDVAQELEHILSPPESP